MVIDGKEINLESAEEGRARRRTEQIGCIRYHCAKQNSCRTCCLRDICYEYCDNVLIDFEDFVDSDLDKAMDELAKESLGYFEMEKRKEKATKLRTFCVERNEGCKGCPFSDYYNDHFIRCMLSDVSSKGGSGMFIKDFKPDISDKQIDYMLSMIKNDDQGQEAKADSGKLPMDLVPQQIIRDIAEVRKYGNDKYGDPDNWRQVEKRRYVAALMRHLAAYVDYLNGDDDGKDKESGIEHHKHMACNMAFICEMEKWEEENGN